MDEVVELLDSQDDTRPGLRRRVRELEQERERERDAREKRDKRVSQLVFGGGLINALILIAAVMVMGARISGVLEQLASVVKKG